MDYKRVFREVFNFLERNNPPRDTDEYWKRETDDIIDTGLRLGNDDFALDLLCAIHTEFEKKVGRKYV